MTETNKCKERFMDITNMVKRLEAVEKRLVFLEDGHGLSGEKPETLELDLTLPEADIDGLRFNETKVHAVFEKKDDGWYRSRDILFLSARNTEDDNSRDILMEYLNQTYGDGRGIKQQIALAVKASRVTNIEISLPKENEEVKKYNGVNCWYWLKDKYASSSAGFVFVGDNGYSGHNYASAVGGSAPAFSVEAASVKTKMIKQEANQ